MSRKEVPIYLGTGGDFIRVIITTASGTVIDFVVQYESPIDEEYRRIVRYDGSHGRGHRDLLDWNGNTIDKQWMRDGLTLGEAISIGIGDLKENWQRYREEFLRRRPA